MFLFVKANSSNISPLPNNAILQFLTGTTFLCTKLLTIFQLLQQISLVIQTFQRPQVISALSWTS